MLRLRINKSLVYAFFFPFTNVDGSNDQVSKQTKLPEIAEMESLSPGEIGIDRLKNMFHDSEGHITKEFQSIMSATTAGIIGGFCFGGISKTIDLPYNFRREHQATKWDSTFHAKRQLHNKFALEFIKGGMGLCWKLGAFCFLFQSTSIMLYVYRGKFELFNSTIAGAVAGSMFKMNMGLKGMIAGTVAGSMLGTVYGSITKLILYIAGVEMSDLYEIHFQLMQKRRDNLNKVQTDYMDEEAKAFRDTFVETKVLQETAKPQNKNS
ncbi:RPII140-upstream gene protein [Lasioglossum baleicum]|uniref:RPII140-upstream gene protein n=1 Tax=Lasioglossum baleicum TaxID=434251 RepID=UPI003FCCC723